MRYDIADTQNRMTMWHDWFAWFPIQVSRTEGRWWEVVERKGTRLVINYDGAFTWVFEYRVKL